MSETPALTSREGEGLRAPSSRPSSVRFLGRLTYAGKVSIATCVVAVLLWWLLARLEVVPAMFLPSPFAVASKLFSVWTDGFQDATLPQHLLASVGRVSAALVGAIVFGVILGCVMHLSETGRGVIEPLLEFYRPIPQLAYLPLVIIWFGIGEFAKILVIFLGILPSIMIATNDGLKSVPPDMVNAARSLGATRSQVILLVLLPHAFPSILTGTRIGLGTGWATLVAAELVAATRGLGFMIKGAADFLVTDVVILGIFVIAAAAITMEIALSSIDLENGGLAASLGRSRGARRAFDSIVLCTGPSKEFAKQPLLADLIDGGLAQMDEVGLGLKVDPLSRVLDSRGVPQANLLALGPITRGSFGEMTGVPDIVRQIERVALALGSSLPWPGLQ